MVTMNIEYQGTLRTHSTHQPSGNTIITDAPLDNKGKGEAYSPTDLLTSSLGSCMLTIMGIKSDDLGITINGTKVTVSKQMSSDPPRRISQIDVDLHIPFIVSHEHMASLERSALSCPVAQSIHPDLMINLKMTCE
ncbi:MAG: osmotically inducible protein OsmC [Gammaproteobacteria bacterium]|nr:MAG: osmotically inducible protein OsmC [Gammaproteobacteria bacterium]